MTKTNLKRYWIYYTAADIIGLFTGIVIYGLFVFPMEYSKIFRIPPDTFQLASTSGNLFYLWYVNTLYLPIILISFFLFISTVDKIKPKRKARGYFTLHRIIILTLYFGIIPSISTIKNGYQFLIPVVSILLFNALAFYLFESRESSLL